MAVGRKYSKRWAGFAPAVLLTVGGNITPAVQYSSQYTLSTLTIKRDSRPGGICVRWISCFKKRDASLNMLLSLLSSCKIAGSQ